MDELFVPYKESLELKELGFAEACLYCYFPNPNYKMGEKFDLVETSKMLPNQIKSIGELIKDRSFENTILTPLYQQAFKWFREKYNLPSEVRFITNLEVYDYRITKIGVEYTNSFYDGIRSVGAYKIYEQAELECLRKLISIIKEQK